MTVSFHHPTPWKKFNKGLKQQPRDLLEFEKSENRKAVGRRKKNHSSGPEDSTYNIEQKKEEQEWIKLSGNKLKWDRLKFNNWIKH